VIKEEGKGIMMLIKPNQTVLIEHFVKIYGLSFFEEKSLQQLKKLENVLGNYSFYNLLQIHVMVTFYRN
jgi:hypothetical protein